MKVRINYFARALKVLGPVLVVFVATFAGVFGEGRAFAANVNNFYFDDFTADYYLTKDSDGVSHLRVVENLTAVFPNYNQNKGICRQIPDTNLGGKNVTLPSLTRSDIKLLRNGKAEPIYSIKSLSDGYEVCTGDESYVLGKQVYTLEYNFSKVITDYDEVSGNTGYGYQELYWDTNGTGWSQKFNKVTARVHFGEKDIKDAYTGKQWCYVGKYGAKDSKSCVIIEISDGVEFSAVNLVANENLTFDIEFKPNTFVVPEPEVSYILIVAEVIFGVICGLLLIIPYRGFRKVAEKRKFYKGYFVVPEYQPHSQYTLPEMAKVYLKQVKDVKVALLLEMTVKKKIEFIKTKDNKILRDEWAIKVLDKDAMNENEKIIVKILNGGDDFENGDKIEIKKHTATSRLASLGRRFDTETVSDLKKDALMEQNTRAMNLTRGGNMVGVFVMIILMLWAAPYLVVSGALLDDFAMFGGRKYLIGREYFPIVVLAIFATTCVVWAILANMTGKYKYRTLRGLEMSRYMDGLNLYIGMAEADRIKFLQDKEKVDISPEGVVKLYEKLLPYAALFGLEKSWMKELERYYKNLDVEMQPNWYRSGITVDDIIVASAWSSAVTRMSSTISSSGGSSSGFSGGGGGGFSGGGGGGGGGGGR